uniref:Peptidase S1 domain-containing protein n=1 Tax=Strigamia maritima TaxID=126957 RepID=T1ITR3_STRMM
MTYKQLMEQILSLAYRQLADHVIYLVDYERIIGGKEVLKNSYPFMVRIESYKADGVRSLCGATLLHEDFVVTAAHCVYNDKLPITSLKLHFGDHQLRVEDDTQSTMDIPLSNVYPHSEFSRIHKSNDIALIKLPQKAPISEHVSPICVAGWSTVSKHRDGFALGWGLTNNPQDDGVASDVLKQVKLPILPNTDCRAVRVFNPKTMICGGNTKGIFAAICIGDSGGPFVVPEAGKYALTGISSFVSGKGCVADGFDFLEFSSPAIDERIIGGNHVPKNSYPFVVRVEAYKADGSGFLCGASLLHENFVVTAAHCVHDSRVRVTRIRLHFGDHTLRRQDDTQSTMEIPMANVQYHAQYSESTINNDIALIRLPQRAPISRHVQPICVASAATVARQNLGTAMGWGLTRNSQQGGDVSEILKEVNLPILPNAECRMFGSFNPQTMICGGNTRGIQAAVCSGDSGGPFVVNAGRLLLTGISSYVSGYGCVAVGYGVVFVRVSNYIPWLQNTMGSALCVGMTSISITDFQPLESFADERIIGGKEARKNSHPFVVRIDAMNVDGDGFLCGATLLNEFYVVTAAHCVYASDIPINSITVHFGDHHMYKQDDTQTTMSIPMSNVVYHSQYNERYIKNDIALIKLPRKAPISAHVKPLCITSAATSARISEATAIGWGLTKEDFEGGDVSEVLKDVTLPILPNDECRLYSVFNPATMMCAGNTRGIKAAICSGDSGGPLVVNTGSQYALTGLTSFSSARGCVAVGFGAVFTRLSGFIPWLQSYMGSSLCISDVDERIIGGNEARKNSYPFVVRIEAVNVRGEGMLCGATLLNEFNVVTAAHCVHDSNTPIRSITLHFGDHHLRYQDDTQTTMQIPMANIVYHPQYNQRYIINDIALIRLPRRAPISNHVKPLCITSAATAARHQKATAIGWGLTRNGHEGGQISEVLKEVSLPILPTQECRLFGVFNPNSMICAGNTRGIPASICSGDSGGPFVVHTGSQYALTGLSSFGSIKGCITVGYGVVFTRLSGFIPWLQSYLGAGLCI